MAQKIRRFGLNIVTLLLRLLVRPPAAGWKSSRRAHSLRGR